MGNSSVWYVTDSNMVRKYDVNSTTYAKKPMMTTNGNLEDDSIWSLLQSTNASFNSSYNGTYLNESLMPNTEDSINTQPDAYYFHKVCKHFVCLLNELVGILSLTIINFF